MCKTAISVWTAALVACCGCESQPRNVQKEIPPTPTASDYQGGAMPSPLADKTPTSSDQK